MELATTLKGETIRNAVREVGINPNHWYAVAWANQVKVREIVSVTIWQEAIAIYRDSNGKVYALEDACPHKGVALHKGIVQGENVACPYHGWEFDGKGNCVSIPYLPAGQKLPCARAKSYPIQEKYGIIWLFPGDPSQAEGKFIPDIVEFDSPDWLMVPVTGHMKAHFSICNENSMDVFHGFLHQNLQGWFDPVLKSLRDTGDSVCAEYDVSYKGMMAKWLGLSQNAREVTTRTISVQYRYPHYYSNLEGVSTLYLMRLPVSPTESRSFALFFFKIRLPQWLPESGKRLLQRFLEKFVFMRFLKQDIEMMETEQQTYLKNPQRRYVEINPAIIAIQRLIVRQFQLLQAGKPEPGDC